MSCSVCQVVFESVEIQVTNVDGYLYCMIIKGSVRPGRNYLLKLMFKVNFISTWLHASQYEVALRNVYSRKCSYFPHRRDAIFFGRGGFLKGQTLLDT